MPSGMLFCGKWSLNYGLCLWNCRVMRGRSTEITGWKAGDPCHVLVNKSSSLPWDKSCINLGYKIKENDIAFYDLHWVSDFFFAFQKTPKNDRLIYACDSWNTIRERNRVLLKEAFSAYNLQTGDLKTCKAETSNFNFLWINNTPLCISEGFFLIHLSKF